MFSFNKIKNNIITKKDFDKVKTGLFLFKSKQSRDKLKNHPQNVAEKFDMLTNPEVVEFLWHGYNFGKLRSRKSVGTDGFLPELNSFSKNSTSEILKNIGQCLQLKVNFSNIPK